MDNYGRVTQATVGSTTTSWDYDTSGETLEDFGLINMPAHRSFFIHRRFSEGASEGGNGRLYDPVVGRFLSPDPYVQNSGNTQNFNRYSYCLNNPLKYTDPSGNRLSPWPAANIFSSGLDPAPRGGSGGGYTNIPGTSTYLGPDGQVVPFSEVMEEYILPNGSTFSGDELVPIGKASRTADEALILDPNGNINVYFLDVSGSGVQVNGFASSQGGGPGWEAYAGAAASIGSEMYYSKTYGTWMGKNFKMYKQTWGGNGFTGGKNKFGKSTSNSIKWAGRIVGLYSGYQTIDQRINGEIGTGWMVAELGTTGVSTFGGLYGAAWGVGWELGRAVTTLDAYQEFKFNFWYNRLENRIGAPSPINEGMWYDFFNNYGQ